MNYRDVLREALSHHARKDMAKKSGYQEPTLSNWVNGRQVPRYANLEAIINDCGFNLECTIKEQSE